jgi:hypothetical protein
MTITSQRISSLGFDHQAHKTVVFEGVLRTLSSTILVTAAFRAGMSEGEAIHAHAAR